MQANPRSDGSAHLADRVFKRQQLLLADVLCQHTWVCAVRTWVRWSQVLRPGRVHAACLMLCCSLRKNDLDSYFAILYANFSLSGLWLTHVP